MKTRQSQTADFVPGLQLDRCILYCILFVFMLALLCFCVATKFSVNKDLYNSLRQLAASATAHGLAAWLHHHADCATVTSAPMNMAHYVQK